MGDERKCGIRRRTAVLLLLILVYGAGVWYYRGHFLPGTVADGMDLSWMSPAQVEERLERYTLTLEERTAAGAVAEEVLTGGRLGLGWGGRGGATESAGRAGCLEMASGRLAEAGRKGDCGMG